MVHTRPGRCPVCGDVLETTRLHCANCDTTIEGRFGLGRFERLNVEQLAFAETFIRCEGKMNRVEEELGISYPTVRNRLLEVIRAMGYEPHEEKEASRLAASEERMTILAQVSRGEISSEEAIKRLRAS